MEMLLMLASASMMRTRASMTEEERLAIEAEKTEKRLEADYVQAISTMMNVIAARGRSRSASVNQTRKQKAGHDMAGKVPTKLPIDANALREMRERTGCGIHDAKRKQIKEILTRKTIDATTVEDLRIIIFHILEELL